MKLLLLATLALTLSAQTYTYFPQNSEENGVTTSGLVFYFRNPPTGKAFIRLLVEQCGRQERIQGTIDTDNAHGDIMLHFPIQDIDKFKVLKSEVTFVKGE